jgi:23S rRNA pseudouridine1911/1915/1917 synthase
MSRIRLEATIPLELAGERLDRVLVEMFPEYSRSRLARWIKSGEVRVDGASARVRQPVHGGEQVALCADLEPEVALRPQPIDLDIRHQDADLIVLVKPAGLVVHPGAGNPDGTLLNALLHHDPSLANLPRAGIVHRLDKDTSGLMVVARSLVAHTALVAMLSRHDVERCYEAVVTGALIAGGSVDAPLGRHPRDRLRQAVQPTGSGKRAITHYRLRERYRAHSLIACRLETGRTHQIRVHMAHAGHPLVGDPLYGGHLKLPPAASETLAATLRGFHRQALHAERLAFAHPVTGSAMEFKASRPDDMQALVDALRDDSAQG